MSSHNRNRDLWYDLESHYVQESRVFQVELVLLSVNLDWTLGFSMAVQELDIALMGLFDSDLILQARLCKSGPTFHPGVACLRITTLVIPIRTLYPELYSRIANYLHSLFSLLLGLIKMHASLRVGSPSSLFRIGLDVDPSIKTAWDGSISSRYSISMY
ncbi:hypothetical protein CPB84DRAFT_971096 [Gymnopilus junonius]|uniref:Uncharacterized protein n=1 Tax=Gymnopilus junonius TaxID=109634 RepID=A0A9P5NNP7_GYMJU|nr:hypothetical protein CPB84DRAFT_971096 [Gymnopilus junonius]